MQVFVLGMHRSGTSAITRLLIMSGAYFGPEGISNGADEGNPKGFWERVDVRAVCDGLLQESGYDWWKVADFDLDRIPDKVRARHVGNFRKILLDLDAHRPWVLKEPRLSLLFPAIRPLLELPVCIHVTREPLEVASSLQTRNGIPVHAGLALWELYTIRAFAASAGLPRVHVRYEDLMAAPVAVVERLVGQLTDLGVAGLRVPSEREITAYLDPALHRERRASTDRGLWLNDQQQAIAAAIDDGSALDDATLPRELSAGAQAQLRTFEEDRARQEEALLELQARVKELEERAALDADRITRAQALLERADRQLSLAAGSRSWRLSRRISSLAHPRLRRGGTGSATGEPLERTRTLVEQARERLTADS